MEDEAVLEKLKKLAIIKYDGRPEAIRDLEVLSHYYIFIWDEDSSELEWAYRQTKAMVIDMWFEGKFTLRDQITMEDLQNLKKYVEMQHAQSQAPHSPQNCSGNCDECDNEECEGPPPPPETEQERKAKTTYIC